MHAHVFVQIGVAENYGCVCILGHSVASWASSYYKHACIHACMYTTSLSLYISVYSPLFGLTDICINTHTHTCMYLNIDKHTKTQIHMFMCACFHTHQHTCEHTYSYVYACHSFIHKDRTHTVFGMCTYIYIYIYIYICEYIKIYIDMYLYIYLWIYKDIYRYVFVLGTQVHLSDDSCTPLILTIQILYNGKIVLAVTGLSHVPILTRE